VCSSCILDSIYYSENISALQPNLIEPRWVLYCEIKSNDVFTKNGSGDIINPDDQIYTKSHANGAHKFEHDYYTVVLTLSERFGMNGARVFKDSGNSPELAYRALLKQLALKLTDSGYIPM
jgi:hypothetical protein